MRITLKQLKSLEVETQSGTALGKVHDVTLQTDGQHVVRYHVRSSRLGGKEYLVGRDQIVRFEETRLIVVDTLKPIANRKKKKLDVAPKPIAMRKQS